MSAAAGSRTQTDEIDTTKCKSLKTFIRQKEREYLQQILDHMDGDKEKAAKALKISLATLYRKLPPDSERDTGEE